MQGIDPRMMKQAMKRMGIQQTELEARRVIIELEDKRLVFDSPGVAKVTMMGEETYQITGEPQEESYDVAPSISEEDIQTVAEQAQVSEEEAKRAIEEANGDLAQAILKLKSA